MKFAMAFEQTECNTCSIACHGGLFYFDSVLILLLFSELGLMTKKI